MSHLTEASIVTTLFESPGGDDISNRYYRDVVLHNLKKILPDDFLVFKGSREATLCRQTEILQKSIPLITFSCAETFPGTISFFLLSKYRPNSFKFFFEMISRWLTPGRRLNVVLVYASDFRLTSLSEDVYTICEVMISVVDQIEFEEIQRNFPVIQTEIALGIDSEYYAQRLLEIKGLTADDKTAFIQASIAFLVKRFPEHYDSDVFTEMQHVLVSCPDEFKAIRASRHLSRMISIQYLFRKALREEIKKNPRKRYVYLKIFRAFVQSQTGAKKVLSFLVGVNFIGEQENFGESNLIKAIQFYVPSATAIEGSFFIHKLSSENICLSYIEVEKKEGVSFSSAEIRKLRRELPGNLKNRIEERLHTVFMSRNEEEVMRNILTLTNQIKYVRDIPQVSISFDEQAYAHLYFTVILARLVKSDHLSISELFSRSNSDVEYLHDRTKEMGILREKYVKEATVFRLKLAKECFLRTDHSIDLYKARQAVVKELYKVIGEFRDFNGGMISKQHELLSEIRELLKGGKDYDELLLENFFYSLSPVVARALLDPFAFKTLFLMLQEGIKEHKSDIHYFKFHHHAQKLYGLVVVDDLTLKETIRRAIQNLHIPPADLAYASIKTHGLACLGYICRVHDAHKREQFQELLVNILSMNQ
ncbi:MAG: hypothetical protein ACH350_06140 [Parachlamydiaceae bacterium]